MLGQKFPAVRRGVFVGILWFVDDCPTTSTRNVAFFMNIPRWYGCTDGHLIVIKTPLKANATDEPIIISVSLTGAAPDAASLIKDSTKFSKPGLKMVVSAGCGAGSDEHDEVGWTVWKNVCRG